MKRILISIMLMGLLLPLGSTSKPIQFTLGNWLWKPASNQALLTTSSPTFAGLTLSGGTASTLAYLNASKAFTSLANGSGYLLNDGSGGLSWGALDLSPYIKKDGSTELTTDWNVGAFDLTCVDMTATNFKLSGTGTLTSTLGNATFTTALTAASGNEAAFTLNYTTNKAAGNDTGLVVNMTDTASPGTSLLADFQVGGVSKAYITNSGGGYFSALNTVSVNPTGSILNFGNFQSGTSTMTAFSFSHLTAKTLTSGSWTLLEITPSYNQTSGTAANTDLLINRTETAIGSGTQRLLSAQVGSVERVGFDNKGFGVRAYPLACTHDTATALFGITIAAGSTAGGVITYTLNVTDDDGSDDQIEVGTVQFVGLQDEANWHTNIAEVSTQAAESGTLATTWAIDTATANTLKVTLQATSNLTSPVYTLSYTVTFNNSYVVTTY